MALYGSAGGESWLNNRNWMSGAPCTDEWHGVVCCPESHPRLQSLDPRVCENGQGEPMPDGFAAGQTWPLGCASGSSTGTSIDRERCVVVGLALDDNNLNGELNDELTVVDSLQAVDLRGNEGLGGSLPSWVTEAPLEVRLGVNDFDYNDGSSFASLFTRCRTDQGLSCEGLPPRSCRAFGDDHVVSLEDPSKCVACGTSLTVAVSIMVLLLLLFAACLVVYIRLIYKYPDALRKGVNTASLLIGHMQTVSILTSLKLSWPSSVLEAQRWVFSPVNFLDLGATRPECVFGSIYYTFQIGRVWSVMVLLLSVPLVQWLLKRKHRRARTYDGMQCFGKMITEQTWDSFELAETIIFQIQFFVMLRAILGLLDSFGSHDDGALFAATSALLLLILEVGLVVKYLLNVRALVTGRTVGGFARLSADRLKLRMSYLTRRFADHAPYWQFVVWSRQLLLAIDAWLTRSIIVEATRCSANITSADACNATASDDAYQGVSVSGDNALVLGHAVAAVVFLLVYAAVHVRVQPYVYEVQNTLETWLFVSDVMFVSLGIGYSFMDPQDPNRHVVEPLLVLLLLGTLVLAAAYLSWHHRRYLQGEVTERAVTMRKKMSSGSMITSQRLMITMRTTFSTVPEQSKKDTSSASAGSSTKSSPRRESDRSEDSVGVPVAGTKRGSARGRQSDRGGSLVSGSNSPGSVRPSGAGSRKSLVSAGI